MTAACALDAAWDLVKDWTAEEHRALRDGVGKQAFKMPFPQDQRARTGAQDAGDFCGRPGRRAALDAGGAGEEGFS